MELMTSFEHSDRNFFRAYLAPAGLEVELDHGDGGHEFASITRGGDLIGGIVLCSNGFHVYGHDGHGVVAGVTRLRATATILQMDRGYVNERDPLPKLMMA